MRANKHLLLWSSLGTLIVLLWSAIHETFLQEWRRAQAVVQAAAPEFEPRLRQVVVPALRVKDRCVTCHVGMAAGEEGVAGDPVYGAHPPLPHDPAAFGCTVCHGGQGLATTKEDAHGWVEHWPEPMLTRPYFYAGCGSCHTHVAVPNIAELRRGEALFERYDCLACHRVDGRGGTLRPGGAGGAEGPDLSRVGAVGIPTNWYEQHLDRHRQGQTPAWRSAFGEIPDDARLAIETFLGSRVGAPDLVESKALFHSLGCRGCHAVAGVGGTDGPDLTVVGQRDPAQTDFSRVPGKRDLAAWFKAHLRAPARVAPGSLMPDLGLSEAQIEQLTFYTFSLRRSAFPESFWPKDRVRAERLGEREFSTDGETIFRTFCAACHGPSGEGMRYPGMAAFPAIGNPDFLAVASDEFLVETIRRGRPSRRMPPWGGQEGGLRPAEIDAVVAYLRVRGPFEREDRPPRWVSGRPEEGAALFATNCAPCHGKNGEGGEGPALAEPALLQTASDSFLFETIRRGRAGTSMPSFAKGSTTYPALANSEIESLVAFIRTWENTK